ncbi:hypothetical protein pb186bvf_012696 [Paramecium bursaria]
MITTQRKKLEKDLANLIKAISYWTIHIENYKIGMAENHEFELITFFRQIDQIQKKYFTQRQFHTFLSSISINCSHKECDQLWADLFNNSEYVDEKQFAQFILPQNPALKQYQLDKEISESIYSVQFARNCLKTLFERYLQQLRELNQIRELIHYYGQINNCVNFLQKSFDLLELWKLVANYMVESHTEINEQCLQNFIKSNGGKLSHDEYRAILRFLNAKETINQIQFNNMIMPPSHVLATNFNEEIRGRIKQKYRELNIEQPKNNVVLAQPAGQYYNFRKVFDPVVEGRPQFTVDKDYLHQLNDYRTKYLGPSRNYQLQYRNNPQNLKDHDFHFKDYYEYLYNQDQEELFFNRFGRRYVYQ